MKVSLNNGKTVELREFITGRQREYIDAAQFLGVVAKPTGDKHNPIIFEKVDAAKIIEEGRHREIESWVLSVDGKKPEKSHDLLNLVLDLPEDDYNLVLAGIEQAKKKPQSDTTQSSSAAT